VVVAHHLHARYLSPLEDQHKSAQLVAPRVEGEDLTTAVSEHRDTRQRSTGFGFVVAVVVDVDVEVDVEVDDSVVVGAGTVARSCFFAVSLCAPATAATMTAPRIASAMNPPNNFFISPLLRPYRPGAGLQTNRRAERGNG
jgi:hypothetical protein